jgi:dipeptidase
MIRLAFLLIVVLVAGLVWVVKLAAGAATGNQKLQNTTFKQQATSTMNTTAKGLNWLEQQWEQSKSEAAISKDGDSNSESVQPRQIPERQG